MTTDTHDLANELVWFAESDKSSVYAGTMHQAAAALRAQADRIAELEQQLSHYVRQTWRCQMMIPNAYGQEQCGRHNGHEGKCCYARMD